MKQEDFDQQRGLQQSLFTEGIPQTIQDMAALRDSRREQQAQLFRRAEQERGLQLEGSAGETPPDGAPDHIQPCNKTVVMFSLVIPGPIKNNHFLEAVFDEGCHAFLQQLEAELHISEPLCMDEKHVITESPQPQHIVSQSAYRSAAGCTAFWLLNTHAVAVKQLTTALERTHPLGMLWDFDVFSEFERKLSAAELGLPIRTCLICGKPAKVCARSRTHSVPELQAKISELIFRFF